MQDHQQQCALCDSSATVWTSFVSASGGVRKTALCASHAQACGWLDNKGWGLLEGWSLPLVQQKAAGSSDDLLQTALSAMVEGVSWITGGHFKSVAVQLHKIDTGAVEPGQKTGAPLRDCCPQCGFTVAAWKELGRLGCPDCYQTFKHAIQRQLPHLHGGADAHLGKIPQGQSAAMEGARRKRIGRLREQLAAVVRSEDYEQASCIRDTIRKLEGQSG